VLSRDLLTLKSLTLLRGIAHLRSFLLAQLSYVDVDAKCQQVRVAVYYIVAACGVSVEVTLRSVVRTLRESLRTLRTDASPSVRPSTCTAPVRCVRCSICEWVEVQHHPSSVR